jgi:hypothetical protein
LILANDPGGLFMMTKLFLLPLFLHVLLILWVGLAMLFARIKAVRNGSAKLSDIAADSSAWPRRVRQLGGNFSNQFETPMLWYALAGLVVALKFVDMVFVGLSWMYLITRIAHSLVHTSNNDVPSRLRIFLFGFATLFLMWMWFGFKLLFSGTL